MATTNTMVKALTSAINELPDGSSVVLTIIHNKTISHLGNVNPRATLKIAKSLVESLEERLEEGEDTN